MSTATPKRYIHDRIVLLVLSTNVFFTVLIGVLMTLALTRGTERFYTIEHRPSLGLSANQVSNATQMSSFIIFVVMVLIFNTILSVRVYPIRRQFAIVILIMGTLLVLM